MNIHCRQTPPRGVIFKCSLAEFIGLRQIAKRSRDVKLLSQAVFSALRYGFARLPLRLFSARITWQISAAAVSRRAASGAETALTCRNFFAVPYKAQLAERHGNLQKAATKTSNHRPGERNG
jgi:hypothetical protein